MKILSDFDIMYLRALVSSDITRIQNEPYTNEHTPAARIKALKMRMDVKKVLDSLHDENVEHKDVHLAYLKNIHVTYLQ